jgi:hypothetical protein
MRPSSMKLKRIRAALAGLDHNDLRALRDTAAQTGNVAPGLFAWLEHVAGWELDRRVGQNYVLRMPSGAIEPAEVPEALDTLYALAATFRNKGGTAEVDELFAAAAEVVRGDDPVP